MKGRKGLGKGLAALITDAEIPDELTATVTDIPVNLVDPNPFQPRQVFDEESIAELTQSIRAQGLLQPVLVRRHGERYQLIIGERRWRAARAAGLAAIPSLVREAATDEEMLELAILENVQRQDLNPIELALALQKLQTTLALTQESIAEKLGVSRAHVANTLRLLKLPEYVKAALADNRITSGHARALLAISDPREQKILFERFLADGRPTVREAEDLTRRSRKTGSAQVADLTPGERRQQVEIAKIEERLRRILSTRVNIKPRGRGGVLLIKFYSSEDLERILEFFES